MNQIADTKPGEYYVTVIDGSRWARIEGGDKIPIRAGQLNQFFGLPTE